MSNFDWDEFEAAIRLLKSGIDELPFRDVVLASTGHEIIPFDDSTRRIIDEVESCLLSNFSDLSKRIQFEYVGRPNELGNEIEKILIDLFNTELTTIVCERPRTKDGQIQISGYPDGILRSQNHSLLDPDVVYFDVKIYQSKTKDSTFRTFYYQPTNQSKIHHTAPHFLIGFEVESLAGNNQPPFRIVNFNIVDIYDMHVKFKAEFNTHNRNIYSLPNP